MNISFSITLAWLCNTVCHEAHSCKSHYAESQSISEDTGLIQSFDSFSILSQLRSTIDLCLDVHTDAAFHLVIHLLDWLQIITNLRIEYLLTSGLRFLVILNTKIQVPKKVQMGCPVQ